MSLPLRECGLKSKAKGGKPKDKNVTPFAGVWIEICLFALLLYAGKWSLPLRECGLKYPVFTPQDQVLPVTPFVGVWIEIKHSAGFGQLNMSLPLWECGLK